MKKSALPKEEQAFLRAVVAVPARYVAKAMHNQAHGVTWTHCTKGQMAHEYGEAQRLVNPTFPQLKRINLKHLRAQCTAIVLGNQKWREVTELPGCLSAIAKATEAKP